MVKNNNVLVLHTSKYLHLFLDPENCLICLLVKHYSRKILLAEAFFNYKKWKKSINERGGARR